MSTFHINARYALITYAQCGSLDPFAVVNHFANHHAECIVGRELHADGGVHLHVFVDFGRKFRSRSATIFDVEGFHPNISPSLGNPGRGWDYATKDGDIVAGGLERPGDNDSNERQDIWAQIIMAPTRDEFFDLVRRHQPRTLATSFVSLEKYADWHYRLDPEPYTHDNSLHFDTSLYPDLDQWYTQNIQRHTPGGIYTLTRTLTTNPNPNH